MAKFNLRTMNNIEEFFKEYCIESHKSYLLSGNNNLSVDGTGIIPSINSSNAPLLKPLIEKYMPKDIIHHMDLGGGMCWLSKILDEYDNFKSYAIEGSNSLIPHIVHNKSKVVIADLSKEFTDKRLYKAFDITTSFELIEHIHRTHQLQFWKNALYMSNYHLCSIHVKNEEHSAHCTINKPETWERIFNELDIQYEIINDFPLNFDCSISYFLTFPEKITKNSNFK